MNVLLYIYHRFAAGCLTEFLGIYLITVGRSASKSSNMDNNTTKGWDNHNNHSDLTGPPSISVRPSTPCSFSSSVISSASRNQKSNDNTNTNTEITPLLCERSRVPTIEEDERYHSSVSSHHTLQRQGSMFGGISLHSQLARGGMSDDERVSIDDTRR